MRFLSLEVALELDEAIATYEQQLPGRGERFRLAVQGVFQRIQHAPLSFTRSRVIDRPILRRALVARFPYAIYFYLLRGEPIVAAIAHGRRQPAYWRKRLR